MLLYLDSFMKTVNQQGIMQFQQTLDIISVNWTHIQHTLDGLDPIQHTFCGIITHAY